MSHLPALRPLNQALTLARFTATLTVTVAGVLGLAAGPLQAGTPGSSAAPATPATASADKASSAWHTVRGKHTGSGVVLRYAVPDKIAVGETFTVRLQFLGVTANDGATVEVRERATRTSLLSLSLTAGEPRTVELPYASRVDGMQFLDVSTTQGGRVTVQSIPLRIGTGELKTKPQGQRSTTADGDAVISLPAATPSTPSATR